MRRLARRAGAGAIVLALTLAAIELGARTLVAAGWLETPPATGFDEPYWEGDRADFGVWRRPNATFHHRTPCFDVTYRTNSVGARDRERPHRAEGPRVVVLGDSFAEGWGVAEEARFSNGLEAKMGMPFLNFAMPHFSPYQSLLVYRDLARAFDHEAVILTVLPVNDFVDLDLGWASERQADYLYRYRPYLVPDGDGFRRVDSKEPALRRFLRRGSTAWNAITAAWRRLAPETEAPLPGAGRAGPFSFWYDASDAQVALLEHVLSELRKEAGDREVVVVLLPAERDLVRHEKEGPDPLGPRLEAFGRTHGVRVVSLLDALAARPGWREFFFSCDYHLNPAGHAAVSLALARALGEGWLRSPEARHE